MPRMTKRDKYFKKKKLRNMRKIRRRRTRVPIIIGVLTLVLLCVLSVTVFFNLTEIKVTNNQKYNIEEIIEASSIKIGTNLFQINKFKIEENIKKKLTYITNIEISRTLPGVLNIKVFEGIPAYYISLDKTFILNKENYILETLEPGIETPKNIPIIDGVKLTNPVAGKAAVFENSAIMDKLETLITYCDKYELIGKLSIINIQNEFRITMKYDNRVDIVLGNALEMEQKIKFIRYIIDSKPTNEIAILDVSNPKSAGYTQTGIVT